MKGTTTMLHNFQHFHNGKVLDCCCSYYNGTNNTDNPSEWELLEAKDADGKLYKFTELNAGDLYESFDNSFYIFEPDYSCPI